MKIGNLTLATGRPQAERLLASTGYSPEAMRELLDRPVLASTVAAALLACASGDDLPERHDLAVAIEAAGIDGVRASVRKLYNAAAPKKGAANGPPDQA